VCLSCFHGATPPSHKLFATEGFVRRADQSNAWGPRERASGRSSG